MIGIVVLAAGNGWKLIDNSYYSKTWVYDQTALDAPSSFYALTGWHTNDTQASKPADETYYGVGTSGGTNGAVGGKIYQTGDKNLTTANGGTVNLYVSWEKNSYTIYYNPNNTTNNKYGDKYSGNATGTTASTGCFYDTDVTLRANSFSRTGYYFIGWNTQKDGSGTMYGDRSNRGSVKLTKPNFTAIDGGSITLYAIWEPITYNVVLHENDPADATHDITITELSGWTKGTDRLSRTFRYDHHTLPDKDDSFDLVGWHFEDDDWYSKGGTNGEASGTTYKEGNKNLTTTENATLNLYPYWHKNKYTIYYSGNDTTHNIYGDPMTTKYTGSTASTSCLYDTDVRLSTNGFSREGYTFKEWNTSSDGKGTGYQSGEYLTKPNFTYVHNGSVTLYAIWEPKTYNVRLEPCGGTFDTWDDTYPKYYFPIRYDQCVTRFLPSTTIFNHNFIGWARYNQSIEESIGEIKPINEFYYEGNKRIYISNDKSKLANDIFFNPKTDELVIYAWYNRMPTFADVYDGQFFEGQRVSYADLIDLVSVFDYEDDYRNAAVQMIYDLPEVNEDDIYIPIRPGSGGTGNVEDESPEYKFDDAHWVDNGDGTYTKKSNGKVYYTIERKMELEDMINSSELIIKIKDISYEVSNGTKLEEGSWESSMGVVPDDAWGNKALLESSYWLDTSTRRIDKTSLYTEGYETAYANAKGHFNITFEVTDDGIMCGGNLVVDSPFTKEYTRLCTIQYNALPQIYIRNVTWYEDTTDLEDISSILANQLVLDSEDCVNNPPWWYTKASDNMTGEEPKTYHGNGDKKLGVIYKTGSTYNDLQLTLKEEYVWGIVMNPYLDRDHTECDVEQAVSDWVNSGIKTADISALKGNNEIFVGNCTKAEVYDAILSFNVCLDARDQWGKWASGKVDAQNHRNPDDLSNPPDDPTPDPGQPDGPDPKPDDPVDPNPEDPDDGQPIERRSVTVYKINIDTDADMLQANVREQVRFISDKYADEIKGDGSYWGDSAYGYDILQNIFNAKESAESKTPTEYSGSYTGRNGNTVDVKVNDYTN